MTTTTPPPVRPQRRRRSRARTIVPLAIAAWAVLEIWLLILVAGATSGFVVFLCILAGLVLGAAAVKRAGRSAWRNLTASVSAQQQGVAPGPPQGGGRTGLAMLGGLLLIIPGFVSDAVALVLLFPPTRAFIGRRVDRALLSRAVPMPGGGLGGPGGFGGFGGPGGPGGFGGGRGGPGGGPAGGGDKVVQGEVVNRD
ncbi:FxsA family membrane protein [Actinacidiphila sp. bgisy144]|uniref:FxsA family membrane protein n=1 Tax=Actinacidiphila sp. bgisy144 TaxID=3413791 RepID=UPI003EBFB316